MILFFVVFCSVAIRSINSKAFADSLKATAMFRPFPIFLRPAPSLLPPRDVLTFSGGMVFSFYLLIFVESIFKNLCSY